MVAIAKPVPQAPSDLQALSSTAQATALGYPAALQGCTPDQSQYEPGLPWVTPEVWANRPLGHNSMKLIWCRAELGSNDMAPRFPKGCVVNVAPVYERKALVIGKVYLYVYQDAETGEQASQMGRLEEVGSNCLWARADNNPKVGLCWLLRDDEREAVRDVWEVTHYSATPQKYERGPSPSGTGFLRGP